MNNGEYRNVYEKKVINITSTRRRTLLGCVVAALNVRLSAQLGMHSDS